MAQAVDREMVKELEELEQQEEEARRKLQSLEREQADTAAELEVLEEKRRGAVFRALDSVKKSYFKKLLGKRGVKIRSPIISSVKEDSLGRVTTIPKIVDPNLREIEIQPIIDGFSYVRINYDTKANEYKYEAIEPKLLPEEEELLEVLKEILVENVEMSKDSDPKAREAYLRRVVDGLLRELDVSLHPISRERIMYFIFRDFIRYGPIDVTMSDVMVEDLSCDGVNIPFVAPQDGQLVAGGRVPDAHRHIR